MNKSSLLKARKMFDDAQFKELSEFLVPFVEIDDADALVLNSKFSCLHSGETPDEHDLRYVEELEKAAALAHPEALYRLSAFYFTGDGVELDEAKGKQFLDKSMELNFDSAKISVACNLFYGSNGYPVDKQKALNILSQAVELEVEDASEILQQLKRALSEN